MSPPYVRVSFDQGSTLWLAWRTEGIGASDAPTILGENPWRSRPELLAEKCGRARHVPTSKAMAFGTRTEPEARACYGETVGVPVEPVCLQSTLHDWLRASLDGFSAAGDRVVEIKCGWNLYQTTANSGQPPRHVLGQLQHILLVTGLETIDFWCYLPKKPPVLVTVPRDEAYIDRLLQEEAAFWAEVVAERARRADPAADQG